jgi:hypothetical protein
MVRGMTWGDGGLRVARGQRRMWGLGVMGSEWGWRGSSVLLHLWLRGQWGVRGGWLLWGQRVHLLALLRIGAWCERLVGCQWVAWGGRVAAWPWAVQGSALVAQVRLDGVATWQD